MADSTLIVTVLDDHGYPAVGITVNAGGMTSTGCPGWPAGGGSGVTGPDGIATIAIPMGGYPFYASSYLITSLFDPCYTVPGSTCVDSDMYTPVVYAGLPAGRTYASSCSYPSGSTSGTTSGTTSGSTSGCVLAVAVLNVVTSAPVVGAVVAGSWGTSGTTNSAGIALFYVPPNTVQTWQVSAPNYQSSIAVGGCTSGVVDDDDDYVDNDCLHNGFHITYIAPSVAGGVLDNIDASSGAGYYSTYNIPIIDALSVIEDMDGIPPNDCGDTCDKSPTLQWGTEGGSPPYIFEYQLHVLSGSVVASGATIQYGYELDALPAGTYIFYVRTIDAEGDASIWTSVEFTILDCDPEEHTEDPPDDDVEPVSFDTVNPDLETPSDRGWIRYLPRWMNIYDRDNYAKEDSTLYKFFKPFLASVREYGRDQRRSLDATALWGVPVDLPRLGWILQTRYDSRSQVTVNARASGVVVDVRRCSSLNSFMKEDMEPVYLLDDSGRMLLRNLAIRSLTATSNGNSTYYLSEETTGLVEDANVLFNYKSRWWRLKAGSVGIDPVNSVITLPSTVSGTINFHIQSKGFAEAIEVSVSGSPYRTPTRIDLTNRFDELALLGSISRYPNESNQKLRERVYSRFLSRIGVDQKSLAQHISQDLLLTEVIGWNGISSLNFSASGIYGVWNIDVIDVPEYENLTEELIQINTTTYSSSRRSWLPGWFITKEGLAVNRQDYPALQYSNYDVNFGSTVTGTVVAYHTSPNYLLTRRALGFITSVTPVSGNITSGSYEIVLTRNVRSFTMNNTDFINDELLNSNGTSNEYFFDVRERLIQSSPVHFERAKWGRNASWMTESESIPNLSFMPSIFDLESS